MIAKKKTASLVFALIAGCTALSLAAGPALAGPEKGGEQAPDKKNEKAAEQSEAASGGSSSKSSTATSESAKNKSQSASKGQAKTQSTGKSQAKKSSSSQTGSQASGSAESSANTPAPAVSTTGKPAQGCDQADAGYTHNYASTCDGSPSLNGNGSGKASGKPCAGCVGAADNKNPKGQFPDGSDHNNGYECDGNKGIGKGNPAHTSCQPSVAEVAPLTCPEGTNMVGGECVAPQLPCPEGTTMVGDVCVRTDDAQPDLVEDTVIDQVEDTVIDQVEDFGLTRTERSPRVLAAVLPFTGAPALSLLGLGFGLIGAGTLLHGARKRR